MWWQRLSKPQSIIHFYHEKIKFLVSCLSVSCPQKWMLSINMLELNHKFSPQSMDDRPQSLSNLFSQTPSHILKNR
jgi:hypothetical protein